MIVVGKLLHDYYQWKLVILGLPSNWRYLRVGGVDNAWEQEKLEARNVLENTAESHQSSALDYFPSLRST